MRRNVWALTMTPTQRTLTFGSLFAGIGGIDLGLERAGMQCKWQVEIDEYATKVLARHWPDVQRFRDVVEFSAVAGEYPVDLVCGGFPCQPVSLAGARRGDSDERWLWHSFRDVVASIKPRYVLAENVPGLLSAESGRLFGNVVGDLATMGFDVEWGCIPAAAFNLPHLRYRVFIVAYAKGKRLEGHRRSGKQKSRTHVKEAILMRESKTDWRSIKPTVCRGNDGVPNRSHRIRCLGNAVAPHVAEWVGKMLMAFEEANIS